MAKIPCRMAALDLDGTLLNSDHVVTQRNCEALRQLSKEGVLVVLVSGRMHQSILPISDQIGLENPIISYNGGMVKHAKTGEVFHHTPIAATTAMELVDYCDERNIHLNFCLDDLLYIRMENAWSELYESRTGVRATAVGNLRKLGWRGTDEDAGTRHARECRRLNPLTFKEILGDRFIYYPNAD